VHARTDQNATSSVLGSDETWGCRVLDSNSAALTAFSWLALQPFFVTPVTCPRALTAPQRIVKGCMHVQSVY
jgi:hypothetical protein